MRDRLSFHLKTADVNHKNKRAWRMSHAEGLPADSGKQWEGEIRVQSPCMGNLKQLRADERERSGSLHSKIKTSLGLNAQVRIWRGGGGLIALRRACGMGSERPLHERDKGSSMYRTR